MLGMQEISCWDPNCAAMCCLSDRQYKEAKEAGRSFYCTAGHSNVFRPSDNDKLREKITKLDDLLTKRSRLMDTLRRALRTAENNWRCPFGHCGLETNSKGGLAMHIKAKHMAPLMLPAMAGPDAVNSQVN
jgi:hypothetical protein